MKKVLLAFLYITIFGLSATFAQTRTITGKVTDGADGTPIPGVSVRVKGTTLGTVTQINGGYSINVPQDAVTLIFSFVGMKTREVEIGGRSVIDYAMEADTEMVDEVIVVAYGTAKKSTFTGSVSTIKSDQIASRSVSNVTNALAGQTAGVQVSNMSGGQPGTGATIRIRGFGSISASSNPLYVVDGVPFEGNISTINTADIESLSIQKDAAANAIYGARAANGVVIITTKKGTTKEAKVTVDAKWGNNSRAVPNYAVMRDPGMYYETLYKSMYNSKIYNGSSAAAAYEFADATLYSGSGGAKYLVYTIPEGEKLIGTNFKLNPNATLGYFDGKYYYYPDNWYDETFGGSNLRQEYNVSASGLTEKGNYYISAGYLDDTGIIPSSGFTRFSGLAKGDYQVKKWLKTGFSLNLSYSNMKAPPSQTSWGSSGNLFYNTNMIAPIYPMYMRGLDENGKPYIMIDERLGNKMYDFGNSTNFIRGFLPMANPLASLALDKYNSVTDAIMSKWNITVTPFEGLSFTANLGANISNTRYSYLYNLFYGLGQSYNGIAFVQHDRDFVINQQYLMNYSKSFEQHNVEFLIGYESYDWTMQVLGGERSNLYNPWVGELDNGIMWPPEDMYSSSDYYITMGIFSRLQYSFMGKYNVEGSFRRDASSRFHPDNRWGNFGSFGLSWLISKENFMHSLPYINLLKAKLSYGVQGNDKLSMSNFHNYDSQYYIFNDGSDGFALIPSGSKGNKDITWETSYSWNGGFDFALFQYRLNGTIEYYYRTTKDMLYNKQMPLSSGYRFMPINILTMVNKGLEIDLKSVLVKTHALEWSVYGNITWFSNIITDVPELANKEKEIKTSTYIYKKGTSIYNAYMKEWAGVDPITGKGLFFVNDPNDLDNRITTEKPEDANPVDLGSTYAPWFGGFGTTLNAYGFDINIQFSYQMGGRLYDDIYQELMHSGQSSMSGYNWHKDILKSWTPEKPNSDIPRLSYTDDIRQLMSSRFLTSSNYLNLNNISLGYSFPEKWISKASISTLRIYVSGDNLALFSARQGFDPRANIALGGAASSNSSGSVYSLLRTISGGISINF